MLKSARIVGLIANPLSGKDIRRVVAQATVVANHEKVGILRRLLLGMAAVGIDEVLAMPDSAALIERASANLELPFPIRQVDMPITSTAEDTTRAARLMREAGAGCVVTLGGDGTCRAAAKGAAQTPLLPISTGTNNAFPRFIEGTLAGMAAACAVTCDDPHMVQRVPALHVLRDGEVVDLALVDVAAVSGQGLGARAIWEVDRLALVITTRLRPGTIGLSSIGGAIGNDVPPGTAAVAVTFATGGREILAPVAPGVIKRLAASDIRWLSDGESVALPQAAVLALDGEREHLTRSAHWSARLTTNGPFVIVVERALEALARNEGAYVQRAVNLRQPSANH